MTAGNRWKRWRCAPERRGMRVSEGVCEWEGTCGIMRLEQSSQSCMTPRLDCPGKQGAWWRVQAGWHGLEETLRRDVWQKDSSKVLKVFQGSSESSCAVWRLWLGWLHAEATGSSAPSNKCLAASNQVWQMETFSIICVPCVRPALPSKQPVTV